MKLPRILSLAETPQEESMAAIAPFGNAGAGPVTQSSSAADLDSEEQPAMPFRLGRLRATIARACSNPMARQGALSLVDQTISSATNFATSVIIGRLGSRAELGLYVLALGVAYLLRSVQEQIITIPYRTYCHRRSGRSLAAYTGSVLVHQFALSAAAMLGLSVAILLAPRLCLSADFARALCGVLGAIPFLLARESVRQVAYRAVETDGCHRAGSCRLHSANWRFAGIGVHAPAFGEPQPTWHWRPLAPWSWPAGSPSNTNR